MNNRIRDTKRHKLLNARNQEGETPLHVACRVQSRETVEMLLLARANPNVASVSKSQTPLHYALTSGNAEIARLLLAYQADLTAQDREGNTPVHCAFQFGAGGKASAKEFFRAYEDREDYKAAMRVRNKRGLQPSEVAELEFKRMVADLALAYVVGNNKPRPDTQSKPGLKVHHRLNQDSAKAERCGKGVLRANVSNGNLNPNVSTSGSGKGAHHMQCQSSTNTTSNNATTDTGSEPLDAAELSGEVDRSRARKRGLDAYTVVKLLGKGSFGEVYLVTEQDTKRLYAMKVFQKSRVFSQNLIRYTMNEKKILSSTHHPFIVKLHAAFQTRKQLFLILEYCPGGDLSFYLRREKRFTEDRARFYLTEVILALEYLHSRDIVFRYPSYGNGGRDLKPENVVLNAEGHAMLTDFGLSKEGMADNVLAKSFCGSVAYLAPEILKRSGHGKALDWYLVGAMLYEMLVGQPPYYSHVREQLFYNISSGILRIPHDVSEEARSLISMV